MVLNQLGANGKVEYLKAICLTRLSPSRRGEGCPPARCEAPELPRLQAETEAALAPLMTDPAFVRELKSGAEELDE